MLQCLTEGLPLLALVLAVICCFLAGPRKQDAIYLGTHATAEAAARVRDRAVLALQQAGCAPGAVLSFPKEDYDEEQLPHITGVTVLQLHAHVILCNKVQLFFHASAPLQYTTIKCNFSLSIAAAAASPAAAAAAQGTCCRTRRV
jgi:hypothetical protein